MADYEARVGINFDVTQATASLQALQQQISAFQSSLLKGSAASAKSAANLQRDLINNINATGKFAASMTTVASSAENFTRALETNKLSLGQYFRYAGASTKTFGRFFKGEFDTINKVVRERVKTIQTQFIKMGRDANGALQAIRVRPLALDLNDYATKAQLAAQRQAVFNQLLRQGSTNLLNFGKNTQWAGRQLMVGFTIPLSIMGSMAVKEFEKIEKQAIRFKRVYGDAFSTDAETEEALKNVRQLADEFAKYGIEIQKTMELAADAAQMGLKNADLMAQVTEATRLAVLGEVEQQEALETTISVTNAFGIAAEDLAKKIDFLNAVENETVTAISDLTIAIPKAGPVVKQLGGDVEDLAFFLTAMKEGGINASEGANALKSGLASLINPTDKASQMLAGFGININGIVEANKGDIKGIVIGFAQALDTLDPLNRARAIEQLFGKFQFARLSTLFQNVIREGTQAERVLNLSRATAEELAILSERELKRVEDSPFFKFQKALEQFQAALAPLGEEFLKAITPIIEFAKGFLENFNNMSDGAKQFAVVATTVIAGIGPIALMTFGLIANGVANLIKMFTFIGKVFTGFGQKTTDLGLQTNYLTQEQLESQAAAISMSQSHAALTQVLTSEAVALERLAAAYNKTIAAQQRAAATQGIRLPNPRGGPVKARTGMLNVPGPRGAGDIVPALLAPGEAVIPAKAAEQNRGLIKQLIDGDVRGFRFGLNPFASMMSRSRVGVSMSSSRFIEALRSRNLQYQSGFATKTGADFQTSLGLPNPAQAALRARMEQTLFGTPVSGGAAGRPTYGFAYSGGILNQLINILFGGKRGARFNAATMGRSSALSRYGDISLIANRGVGRRSTAFAGDTLLGYSRNPYFGKNQQGLAPMYGATSEQLGRAGFGAFNRPGGQMYPAGFGNAMVTNPKVPFVETQTPGGFSFKEIDKIIARDPRLAKQLKAELSAAGLGNIRVTGSGFTARLFKKLGVPGYELGTPSVKAPQLSDFKLQAAPKVVSQQTAAMTWKTYKAEINAITKSLDDWEKKTGTKLSVAQRNNLMQKNTSHLIEDVTPTQLGSKTFNVKNWRAKNLTPDLGSINQYLQTLKMRKGYLGQIRQNAALLVPELKMTESQIKSEISKLSKGVHPKTKNAAKVLKAISDRDPTYMGAAASATLGARLKGDFYSTLALRKYDPTKDISAAKTVTTRTENLRKRQLDYEALRAGSGVVKQTSGDKKPSQSKRVSGKPSDTRMVAVSPGETIINKKATSSIKRGLFSFIPGLGVLGRADGMPEGQKVVEQRFDKNGKPYFFVKGEGRVSAARAQQLGVNTPQQPAANQEARPRGRFMPSAGGIGMVAGMAAMGYSMTGGPGADIAGMASFPLMMLPALLPMLTNPIALAVVALGGLAVAAFALNEQFKKNVKESFNLTMATGASSQALEKFAEFGGNVTAGQIMDRRRSQRDIFQIAQGKTQFGEAYLESEAGKQTVDAFGKNLEKLGRSGAMKALTNQMAVAVASGALGADQARDIVAALGQEIGDYGLSIQINSELLNLLGPNGENLLIDPLTIRMRIVQDSRSGINLKNIAPNLVPEMPRIGSLISEATGNDLFDNPFLNNRLLPGNIGFAVTDARNQGVNAEQIGYFLGLSTIALQTQQEMVDSLQLEYERRIANAKEQGDLAEATRLEAEYSKARNDLMLENAKTFDQINETFSQIQNKSEVLSSVSEQIKTMFAEDPVMSGVVGGLLQTIDKLDDEQEFVLKMSLLSGDISPVALSNMFSNMTHTATVELITKFGATSAVQISELARLFGNEEIGVEVGGPDVARGAAAKNRVQVRAADKIVTDTLGMSPTEAMDFVAQFDPIIQALSAFDEKTLQKGLAFYYENPDLLKDLNTDLASFKEIVGDKPVTIDIIQQVYGQEMVEQIKIDQAYFDSLPDDQRIIYTTVLRVLGEIDPAARQAAAINAVLAGGKAAELFKKNTGLDYRTATSALGPDTAAREAIKASDAAAAWQVTQAVGPGTKTKTETKTGDGKGKNPLDDIFERLKRVRNASIGAKRDIAELIKLMKPGTATTTLFRGTDQKLLLAGYGSEFIETVMAMDEETRKQFVSIQNGVIKVTAAGKALNKAFAEITLGDYQFSVMSGVAATNKQIEAMNLLVGSGMSVEDALNAVQDEELAYAIATNGTTKELKDIVNWTNRLKEARLQLQLSTAEGRIGYLGEQFSKVQEFFSSQENKLRLQFELDTEALTQSIQDAQQEIAKEQMILDDYQYALDLIAEQEQKINEKYDEREEALDKIYNVNRRIAEQEKSQLDVAQALATGDIAAAARAMQQSQEQRAEQAREAQQAALARARETELSQIKQTFKVWDEGSGKQIEKTMTRKEIEAEIESISTRIAKIEQDRLQPNQRLLTIQQEALEARIKELTFLDQTASKWSLIEANIRAASTATDQFRDKLIEAFSKVQGFKIVQNADGTFSVIVDEKAIQDIVTDTAPGTQEPATTQPETVTKVNPNQEKIDELNRLIQITRWRFYNESLTKAQKDRLRAINEDRIKDVRALGGEPNMTGQIRPSSFGGGGGGGPAMLMMASGGMVAKRYGMGGKVGYYPMGGLIPYMASGGMFKSINTDTVPAMLTPGEFVMRRNSVNRYGTDMMKAINNGTYGGSSVYNYSLNVNVKSDANPDQIARAVMTQIKQVDSQRIRGNRY